MYSGYLQLQEQLVRKKLILIVIIIIIICRFGLAGADIFVALLFGFMLHIKIGTMLKHMLKC